MDFSDSRDNYLNKVSDNTRSRSDENIIILKKVTSIRQLRNTEKEWVRLCYKEAILKGFSLVNHIQCYVASKTKIWIERSGIECLKKSELEEDKKWFYHFVRDSIAYVGAYHKVIDEIKQYKDEMWRINLDTNASRMEKISATRELHNLSRTELLLLRDLPFVTNLSRYFNQDLIKANFHQQHDSQNSVENKKDEKEVIEQKVSERFRQMVDESALFTPDQKRKMGINESTEGEEKITDHVMDDMQKQLTCTPKDILESINNKQYQESIKKIKEIMED